MGMLLVVTGPPGAGKSTVARLVAGRFDPGRAHRGRRLLRLPRPGRDPHRGCRSPTRRTTSSPRRGGGDRSLRPGRPDHRVRRRRRTVVPPDVPRGHRARLPALRGAVPDCRCVPRTRSRLASGTDSTMSPRPRRCTPSSSGPRSRRATCSSEQAAPKPPRPNCSSASARVTSATSCPEALTTRGATRAAVRCRPGCRGSCR